MKNFRLIFVPLLMLSIILWLYACVHETKNKQTATSTPTEEENTDISKYNPIWKYDYDTDTPIRLDSTSVDLTADEAIQIMNNLYGDKIRLDLVRQNEDTLFVKIDTATVLTQQMGSAGARAYMALATFTLTEADGIHVVSFDFKEGDHAYPGVYKRTSYEKR